MVFCAAFAQVRGELALEPIACALEHVGQVDTLDALQTGMTLNLPDVNSSGVRDLPAAGSIHYAFPVCSEADESCLRLDWTQEWIDGLTGRTEGIAAFGACPIEGGWRESYRIVEMPGRRSEEK